jgi:hypothetical protein
VSQEPVSVFGQQNNPLSLDLLEIITPGGGVAWRLRQENIVWFGGSGAPTVPSLPNPLNGNFYLDVSSNGNIWKLQSGTWVKVSTGASIPGGTNTQLQFNNSGAFGGTSQAVYDSANGVVTLTASADTKTPLVLNRNSSFQTAPVLAVTGDISITSTDGTGSLPSSGAVRLTKGSRILWENNGGIGTNGIFFQAGNAGDPDVLFVIGNGMEAGSVYADRALVFNPSTAANTGTNILGNQKTNADDVLQLVRLTDSGPTGNCLRFSNHAVNVDLFKVDITGQTTGTALVLTAAAPSVAASQIGYGSTTAASASAGSNGDVPGQVVGYVIINVAGTAMKVPYYNT